MSNILIFSLALLYRFYTKSVCFDVYSVFIYDLLFNHIRVLSTLVSTKVKERELKLYPTCFHFFVFHSYKALILLLPTILLLAVLAWQLWTQHHRLSHHIRYILIFVYSSLMTFTLSSVVTQFFEEYAIMVLTMSSLGILSNVVYTFQKRFLFRGPKPIVCSSAIICITSLGLRSIYQLDPVEILGPIAISSLICVYVDLEIYYAMYTMTEDEYILANLSFYIDLVYPINALHHACELSDDMDDFPEYFNPDSSNALNHI
ncbi:hypothetical protein EDC96DRAFT_498270 [Choanephora cucurbitarum]|nr:hypothetical protein EDC96DRAFT_498270 [Choanephora cucurbitarum]